MRMWVWMRMRMRMRTFHVLVSIFLTWFHVQMIAFSIDEPIYDILFSSRSTAAGTSKEL